VEREGEVTKEKEQVRGRRVGERREREERERGEREAICK
jgi:hypothetical protein